VDPVTDIAERVAAGAALLDEHQPGWDQRINLTFLSLPDTCCCILGQLFPAPDPMSVDEDGDDGYWRGLRDIDLEIFTFDRACALGFASDGMYGLLENEWIRVITERRAP
jgi:hypothetical protein